jgi:hypothetical protein
MTDTLLVEINDLKQVLDSLRLAPDNETIKEALRRYHRWRLRQPNGLL